jgi:hypothetical protein
LLRILAAVLALSTGRRRELVQHLCFTVD